jgi:hypothetical protein
MPISTCPQGAAYLVLGIVLEGFPVVCLGHLELPQPIVGPRPELQGLQVPGIHLYHEPMMRMMMMMMMSHSLSMGRASTAQYFGPAPLLAMTSVR